MIKNIAIYIVLLLSTFIFNIFYYEWFSWFLFLLVAAIPILSLLSSLPFMIYNLVNGFEIYAEPKLFLNDKCSVFLKGKHKQGFFAPLFRLKLSCANEFSGQKQRFKIIGSGMYSQPVVKHYYSIAKHCGCVKIKPVSCRVYDFLGIFFIPVKIKQQLTCTVIPKSTAFDFPEYFLQSLVVGYKPKLGGSSDYYEMRSYREGDSLRNVHWKLSSKIDELIVKEPTEPVTEVPVVSLIFNSNPDGNDVVLSHFLYLFEKLRSVGANCIVTVPGSKNTCLISDSKQLMEFLKALYSGQPCNTAEISDNLSPILTIRNGEEAKK